MLSSGRTPDRKNQKNNSDKVQCVNCKRYVTKENVGVLMNGTDPLCTECDAYMQDLEQEQYIEVTKEMASDAGLPEMEGQRIRL